MRGSLKSPGHTYRLEGKVTTIGRGSEGNEYHIPLTDTQAERKHALIERLDKEKCFVLTDLNTPHGTYINEHRVQNTSMRLSPGDLIRFGYDRTPYELELSQEVSQAGTTPRMSSPLRTPSPSISAQHSVHRRENSLQPSRKGSSGADDNTSRSSSGLGTESISFRPDTAPISPRDQIINQQQLLLGERSKSVPINLKMPGRAGILSQGRNSQMSSGNESYDMRRASTGKSQQSLEGQEHQPWYISMLEEKEHRLLQMGDEINRLSLHESESERKDNVIFDLRNQIQDAVKKLQEAQNDPTIGELNQRLQVMGDEIARLGVYEEECKRTNKIADSLRQQLAAYEVENQVLRMERASSVQSTYAVSTTPEIVEPVQVISHPRRRSSQTSGFDIQLKMINENLETATTDVEALEERFNKLVPEKLTPETEVVTLREELANKIRIISELQGELDAAYLEQSITEGLVQALQKDIQQREDRIMKLTTLVDKAENRAVEAEDKADSMSKKFSDLKEERKHADMTVKSEYALIHTNSELESAVKRMGRMQEKIDKQSREIRKSHRQNKQGNENDKVHKQEIKILVADLEDLRRRDQLSRVAFEQISARYERLRSRIVQAVFTAPGSVRPEAIVSDVEVSNAVKKIIEDRSEFHRMLEEANQEVPPLLLELDPNTEDDKKEEPGQNTNPAGMERKSGKGGRKSPKHR